MKYLLLYSLSLLSGAVSFYLSRPFSLSSVEKASLFVSPKDEFGYEIKDKSWFEGLSLDAGASLTDPRAIPAEASEFAQKIKEGSKASSLDETLQLIDKHYDYFAVPFSNGELLNEPNVNTGSAKIFSFAVLNKMDEASTLRLFGPMVDDLSTGGTDHQNIRNFIKYGWNGIKFNTGLAIVSKLQAYDDTESAIATQSVLEGTGAGWDVDSDSWIP